MLGFQFAGYILALGPPLVLCLAAIYKFTRRVIRGQTPADKFAAVVNEAMRKDPNILALHYADKWMLKALKRGIYGRRVARFELEVKVMPIDVKKSIANLRSVVSNGSLTIRRSVTAGGLSFTSRNRSRRPSSTKQVEDPIP